MLLTDHHDGNSLMIQVKTAHANMHPKLRFVCAEPDRVYFYDERAVYFGSIEGEGVDAACRATKGKASM